jgi:hypothetical protein
MAEGRSNSGIARQLISERTCRSGERAAFQLTRTVAGLNRGRRRQLAVRCGVEVPVVLQVLRFVASTGCGRQLSRSEAAAVGPDYVVLSECVRCARLSGH